MAHQVERQEIGPDGNIERIEITTRSFCKDGSVKMETAHCKAFIAFLYQDETHTATTCAGNARALLNISMHLPEMIRVLADVINNMVNSARSKPKPHNPFTMPVDKPVENLCPCGCGQARHFDR